MSDKFKLQYVRRRVAVYEFNNMFFITVPDEWYLREPGGVNLQFLLGIDEEPEWAFNIWGDLQGYLNGCLVILTHGSAHWRALAEARRLKYSEFRAAVQL